jgi:hypothetical protein
MAALDTVVPRRSCAGGWPLKISTPVLCVWNWTEQFGKCSSSTRNHIPFFLHTLFDTCRISGTAMRFSESSSLLTFNKHTNFIPRSRHLEQPSRKLSRKLHAAPIPVHHVRLEGFAAAKVMTCEFLPITCTRLQAQVQGWAYYMRANVKGLFTGSIKKWSPNSTSWHDQDQDLYTVLHICVTPAPGVVRASLIFGLLMVLGS